MTPEQLIGAMIGLIMLVLGKYLHSVDRSINELRRDMQTWREQMLREYVRKEDFNEHIERRRWNVDRRLENLEAKVDGYDG